MTSNTSPLHQFKVFVAVELQKKHQWVGRTAYDLLRKYNATVEAFWANGAPVEGVAEFINGMQMDGAPASPKFPTKAGLEAAGCKFYR